MKPFDLTHPHHLPSMIVSSAARLADGGCLAYSVDCITARVKLFRHSIIARRRRSDADAAAAARMTARRRAEGHSTLASTRHDFSCAFDMARCNQCVQY
eukprot:6174567-Pleurochrysis_carterae.AAC.2